MGYAICIIFMLILLLMIMHLQNRIDRIHYFFKHGHDELSEKYRKYMGDKL